MAHVLSPLTLKLAEAIGLYLIAVSIGLLIAPRCWEGLIDGFEASPATRLVAGAVGFWVGAGILLAHHDHSTWLALLVTLFGLIAAFKGLLLLALPPILSLYRPLTANPRVIGIVALILGAILFLAGLTGRADYSPQGVV